MEMDANAERERRHDDGVAVDAEHREEIDGRSTKRRRMDQLIQMSLDFAGVHEAREEPPKQQADCDLETRGESNTQRLASTTERRKDSTDAPSVYAAAAKKFEAKRTWTLEEDAKLVDLVAKLGCKCGEIAKQIATHDRKRCRERYVNRLDPALCQAPWSDEEDRTLLKLVGEEGKRWAKHSSRLSGRSPDVVKNRWIQLTSDQQRQENANCDIATKQPTQRWTVAENDALRALVEANGAKDWFFVASQIPGRTDLQCRQHWYRVLNPEIKKGRAKWSAEEDAVLQDQVKELGHQWEKVAQSLPGRLGKQCRERYVNHLHPSISTAPWTTDEDATLETSYRDHSGQWTLIAKKLPGRAENAIKNRWNALLRKRAGGS